MSYRVRRQPDKPFLTPVAVKLFGSQKCSGSLASAETGTISMPRPFASAIQVAIVAIEMSNAEATPMAPPWERAMRSSVSSCRRMSAGILDSIDHDVGRGGGNPFKQRCVLGDGSHRRRVVEIHQAAAAQLRQKGLHRRGFAGKAAAHVVHHADIVGDPPERGIERFEMLLLRLVDQYRVLARIDRRIANRFQRNLEEQFMASTARRLCPSVQTVAGRREAERHRRPAAC